MTTESFLAAEPHAVLYIPRCVRIARQCEEGLPARKVRAIEALVLAAEEADYQWMYGPSYVIDEAKWDANRDLMNMAGKALLDHVGAEYT